MTRENALRGRRLSRRNCSRAFRRFIGGPQARYRLRHILFGHLLLCLEGRLEEGDAGLRLGLMTTVSRLIAPITRRTAAGRGRVQGRRGRH